MLEHTSWQYNSWKHQLAAEASQFHSQLFTMLLFAVTAFFFPITSKPLITARENGFIFNKPADGPSIHVAAAVLWRHGFLCVAKNKIYVSMYRWWSFTGPGRTVFSHPDANNYFSHMESNKQRQVDVLLLLFSFTYIRPVDAMRRERNI